MINEDCVRERDMCPEALKKLNVAVTSGRNDRRRIADVGGVWADDDKCEHRASQPTC